MTDIPKYELSIDTGGTFTDCIAHLPDGQIRREKVLSNGCLRARIEAILSSRQIRISTNWNLRKDILRGYAMRFQSMPDQSFLITSFHPDSRLINLAQDLPDNLVGSGQWLEVSAQEEAPVLCTRLITETALDEDFPPLELKLGSTKGTNALLEHKGSPSVLLVTLGFHDLLDIGTQQRSDIFARHVKKPKRLANDIIEISERIDCQGQVIQDLDIIQVRDQLQGLRDKGIESIGIALMHAWINPGHEQLISQLAREMAFRYVTTSHEVSPLIKYLDRCQTTEVNSYLSPVIQSYLDHIRQKLSTVNFQVMTSAGGLVSSELFMPKDSLLSGPAGGVIGAAAAGQSLGFSKIISFDMGGTSTDVSRYEGAPDYRSEVTIGQATIQGTALNIETVAAGGGSICSFDGYKLTVGPESAGAQPGPSCYGAGGPLTLTDINLLAGRLDPSLFSIPVFPDHAQARLKELILNIKKTSGQISSESEVLTGFLRIADETMAAAIRKISTERGYDPSEYTLVAFGGAGGMHACSIASILNIDTVLVPGDAGILSAVGISHSNPERFAQSQVLKKLADIPDFHTILRPLEEEATQQLVMEGFQTSEISISQRSVFLRFAGQESSIEVLWDESQSCELQFKNHYQRIFGHLPEDRDIEVESTRVRASVVHHPVDQTADITGEHKHKKIIGPSIVPNPFGTTYIPHTWSASEDYQGNLLLTHSDQNIENQEARMTPEAELELFTRRFMSLAENMGAMLKRTALSVNVKERLDFSCALLDENGLLVANAPHIPVHLGSLGICVRKVLEACPMNPGDTIVTNHPAYGGSHLPDITLITPVYSLSGRRIGFVVNRAHHAEIGGISPGSMPPDASNLEEEGVVIAPFYLVKKGQPQWEGMRQLLTEGRYPSRAPDENLADLNAALAANRKGMQDLLQLVTDHGVDQVIEFMNRLRVHAATKTRQMLEKYSISQGEAHEQLDDETPLHVRFEKMSDHLKLDFSGSGLVHPGNLNANPAIVHSVIMYVLRLMLDEDIPLNDGMLEPVEIILPRGLLNPEFKVDPAHCPALVGGNVEISQRLTDTLIKAFGLQAASQGTMNNLLFGNENFGYYETICGGCGAGHGFDGASAVHHHMTNTRITDPEIMEHRYPVRLKRFEIRKKSGGPGQFKGGDGVIREICFLEPVELSLLTQRRNSGPYGMNGGHDGKPGEQILLQQGKEIRLPSSCSTRIQPNDRLIILTPGGGGYGNPQQ